MSRKVWPDTLHDLQGFGAYLAITCRCGHVGLFEPKAIIDYFRASHWPMAMEVVAQRFTCEECGAADGLRAGMRAKELPPPKPKKPRPIR